MPVSGELIDPRLDRLAPRTHVPSVSTDQEVADAG
jgi:hypothetical protein